VLIPSAERLHSQLAKVEELQGLRDRRTLISMPRSKESKATECEGLERGDLYIYFEPLFDTEAEARMSVEAYCERTCLRRSPDPSPLPWKRTLRALHPPERGRDLDPELDALASDPNPSGLRPPTPGEIHKAMSGLLTKGNPLRGHVVRDALTSGQVPLGDDEAFPCAEFCSSDRGTLLIRIWRHTGDHPRPRPATDSDREQWSSTFHRFIEACLGRGAMSEHPDDENAR
jgi:hypothetical protein